jgi:hypothetical protein
MDDDGLLGDVRRVMERLYEWRILKYFWKI